MATHLVNLDALIRREDFEVESDQSAPTREGTNIKPSDLEQGSIVFSMLRKPDFQRETTNWEPSKVERLVRGFIDADLIPSIIMWRSAKSGTIFVIDGAHRLSALIAWVHDDYGDGPISRIFFGDSIPQAQKTAAKETRDLITKSIGSYQDVKRGSLTADRDAHEQAMRYSNTGILPIELQWVKGDASKAEASFFTINQSATEIHGTELSIIKARHKPNAIAARAIMRAGTGHKYWSAFEPSMRIGIENSANEIYNILFNPELKTPIKTLDLPVAGRGYSADSLRVIFDFVNAVNNLREEQWIDDPRRRGKGQVALSGKLDDDKDGTATIGFLKNVNRIATRISGTHPRSLGLHPAVYFYGATGRFQPTAFLATVALIQDMENRNSFHKFTRIRSDFEEFLLRHRHFINQIVRQYGSRLRGLQPLLNMYKIVIDRMTASQTSDVGLHETDMLIINELRANTALKDLKDISPEDRETRRNFSTETKSAAFLRDAIDSAVRCAICNSRIHVNGISIDHVTPKRKGGIGRVENARLAHPFCNSGYIERTRATNQA